MKRKIVIGLKGLKHRSVSTTSVNKLTSHCCFGKRKFLRNILHPSQNPPNMYLRYSTLHTQKKTPGTLLLLIKAEPCKSTTNDTVWLNAGPSDFYLRHIDVFYNDRLERRARNMLLVEGNIDTIIANFRR